MIPTNIKKQLLKWREAFPTSKIHIETPSETNEQRGKLYELIEENGVFKWRRRKEGSVKIW